MGLAAYKEAALCKGMSAMNDEPTVQKTAAIEKDLTGRYSREQRRYYQAHSDARDERRRLALVVDIDLTAHIVAKRCFRR